MIMTETTTITTSSINKENWHEKKNRLIEKYPQLTELDLVFEDGKTEELIDRIHSKIGNTVGKTKESLHKFIEWL